MIKPIEIQIDMIDLKKIVHGYLVDEHYAIYRNKYFELLRVQYTKNDLFLQDGPHVQLFTHVDDDDDKAIINKLMAILHGKSAWWFLTEVLDISQEVTLNIKGV